jgi:hypothetical protein
MGTTVDWGKVLNVFKPDAVWAVDSVITLLGAGYGDGGYGKNELNNANSELYFALRV